MSPRIAWSVMRRSTGVSAVCGFAAGAIAGGRAAGGTAAGGTAAGAGVTAGAATAPDPGGAEAGEPCPEPLCVDAAPEPAPAAAEGAGAVEETGTDGVAGAGAGAGTGVDVAVCAKPSRIASAAKPKPRPIRVQPTTLEILNGLIVLLPADRLRLYCFQFTKNHFVSAAAPLRSFESLAQSNRVSSNL